MDNNEQSHSNHNFRFSADGNDMVNLFLFGYRSTTDKFRTNADGMTQSVNIIYFQ